MKTIEPIRFNETDYTIDGLFVKGISRIEPTCLKTPILMVHGACHGWWAYHKWLLSVLPDEGLQFSKA